jgi:triacylglycerol lipase
MKPSFLSLLMGLVASGTASARNPEPLHFQDSFQAPASPVRKIVLVHGFLENGNSYQTMRRRLEKQGIACFVPKLRPCDGRGGLEALAQQLKQDIEATYGKDQPISIVAFSMGGLISRIYLQDLGGATRCEKFFTISSPHHGTMAAWIYPSKGAEQMRPGSELLRGLQKTESKLGDIPVVSYRTPLDLVILPASNSVWDRAENIAYPALLHPLMLTSNALLTDIEKRLLD